MHRNLSFRNAARDPKRSTHSTALRALFVSTLLLGSGVCAAETIQIFGPAGSVGFGTQVKVLPNGNVVVTDPSGQSGNRGAVYLYSRSGTLISTLTGSTPGDRVGSFGIVVLSNGNFVISSPSWDNGGAVDAGAFTWASGSTGVSGVVSASNSIVGSSSSDGQASRPPVLPLSNGNYVVYLSSWDNAGISDAGAVRWCSGTGGCVGAMSAANALVGSTPGDQVGNPAPQALSNGNYVVNSRQWDNAGVVNAGASTWGNGSTGTTGVVSTSNSLFGTAANHAIGFNAAHPLSNGNYVVSSPFWYPAGLSAAGAATWVNGGTGRVGAVSAANSLVGSSSTNQVGRAVLPLSNGNYVVQSNFWDNGAVLNTGAATWGNGLSGIAGVVSAANSLVGSAANDEVGINVVALSNGHYVTSAPDWDNGTAQNVGAATWGNGSGGTQGPVSAANSLIGGGSQNRVGSGGITALTNGNYVVGSREWDNGAITDVGAATWRNGSAASAGVVGAVNSLIGSTAVDAVAEKVVALSNGNYVVVSLSWDGAQPDVGATTWANGGGGLVGVVSAGNSWVGSSSFPTALNNSHYVLRSPSWDNGAIQNVGAATWVSGSISTSGVVGASNSLIGNVANDQVSFGDLIELAAGFYLVFSPTWDNGVVANAGAITLLRGDGPVAATITLANSIIGTVANSGNSTVFDFNSISATLAIGQPASNVVAVVIQNSPIFRDGFE